MRSYRQLVAIAAMLLGAAAPASIATQPISRMSTPWWKARFELKRRELQSAPPQLVWLGDSITQDWELDGPEPWRRFAPIWQAYYGDRHSINLGFKGDSTCHVLWRLGNGELDAIHPKLVVLLIGANNFGHIHTDADSTLAGIERILSVLHGHLPATRVIVIGVLPSIRSAWVDANTIRLNTLLAAKLAHQPMTSFVDASAIFKRDGPAPGHAQVDPARYIDPHLVPPDPPLHPDPRAQAELAALIEPLVAQAMGDRVHTGVHLPLD